MKRFLLGYVLPTLLALVWVTLPLILGSDTLFMRDAFNTHLEKKWVQAEAMREGYLPLVDPYRDGGQPHLGNPNTVPLYPDNVLYLLAPTLWAFNAHFWIHLLLAPFCFFALGRSWRLTREAAWAAAVCYGTGGYFLSNLNLYNLVAGTAWTPALVAAAIHLTGPRGGRRSFLATGLIWTLLLLSGDPMTSLMALVLASLAVIFRWGWRGARWRGALVSVALGSLIAAPQWVEFLRILPLSFRGYLGYSATAATAASWPPLAVAEWLLPFFFGAPDLSFWGQKLHGGDLPLFPTLYPGVLAILLVLASGRPSSRAARWAWTIVGLGVFLALGEHNPLVRLLLQIPGADLLRLPVKFWLFVAVGMALLCGLGFDRILSRSGQRVFWLALAGLGGLFLLVWLALGGPLTAVPAWLESALTDSMSPERLVQERLRWAGSCLLSLALLASFALVYRLGRGRRGLAGAVLLVLHVAGQLFFLKPVLPMDSVSRYRQPPALLEHVPEPGPVTHAKANGLFGAVELPLAAYPDSRLVWLQRQVFQELYPVAGILWGRRYDFSISAEGLDAFLTRAVAQSLGLLSDAARVRVLAASGVRTLLLDRPLDSDAADLADLQHREPGIGGQIYVYRVAAPAAAVQFVGRVERADHLNAALSLMVEPRFDARRVVVLPAGGSTLEGPPGEVEIVAIGPESMQLKVWAPAPGVLLIQRAFLPLYRASADGQRVPIVAANIHRLGVELPAGQHVVRVWIDRRPLLWAFLAAVAGLLVLACMAWRLPGRRHC